MFTISRIVMCRSILLSVLLSLRVLTLYNQYLAIHHGLRRLLLHFCYIALQIRDLLPYWRCQGINYSSYIPFRESLRTPFQLKQGKKRIPPLIKWRRLSLKQPMSSSCLKAVKSNLDTRCKDHYPRCRDSSGTECLKRL